MPINVDPLVRSLPDLPDVMEKIRLGLYRLCGGVVRHASGTGKGGQIVGHLVFPSDSEEIRKRLDQLQSTLSKGLGSLDTGMGQLQQSIGVLQGLQSANLVMSGLNLAVTTAGFIIVCKKLDGISEQIQAQSHGIAQIVQIVSDIQERSLLQDEADFRGLALTAKQFCEQGDAQQLKSLIEPFHKKYQFTKLVLEKHASIPASSIERLGEIQLLQDRLVNLGLMLSHVQMKTGALKHSRECVMQMESDLTALNARRVDVLINDRAVASTITHPRFAELKGFLRRGKEALPALSYQADVIELEMRYPGLLERTSGTKEIMLVAA
ncbi:hypothetical protein [Pseudomonas sp. p106]|uniref:hypothetical protein n=1 Tax=Pseudomonas sp. p106 TaxID=2479854 RepID=UPI000F7A47D4|nr:hypothetical protein [Pseudomonas sp. p106]RRV45801.1 hypothetical protein EGJ09_12310 [Pseudomonas sp. p106]